jgi:predicted nucleic acid-binding protein
MKVYCDTSVLASASISAHPHHAQAKAQLKQVQSGKLQGVISAHGTAEFYAVLTRVPLTPPIYPSEARRLLAENILPHFQIAALSAARYSTVLRQAAEKDGPGALSMMHCTSRLRPATNAKESTHLTFDTFSNSRQGCRMPSAAHDQATASHQG